MPIKQYRVLHIISHPTQYYSPLLKLISQNSDIDLSVLYYWDKTDKNFDVGFKQEVKWDVPLLEGYHAEYLADHAKKPSAFSKLMALWKIIDPKKYDIAWVHGYTDIYMIAAILFAKIKRLKVFTRGDSTLFPDSKKFPLKMVKRHCFFRLLNLFVDRFLAAGTANKNFYMTFGIPKKKIFICGYSVDNDLFKKTFENNQEKVVELKKSLSLDSQRPIILYMGKFTHQKCVVDLIDAYSALSQNNQEPWPYLVLVGTGELWEAMQAKITEKNWGSARFIGFKNQTELPDFYALGDVLVTMGVHEKWGLVVNEAMNAGCAIIASDHLGCVPDLVHHNVNGFIYPARDVKMLSHYLKILTQDSVLCEEMKKQSLKIISRWGLPESAAGLYAACQSLFSSSSR